MTPESHIHLELRYLGIDDEQLLRKPCSPGAALRAYLMFWMIFSLGCLASSRSPLRGVCNEEAFLCSFYVEAGVKGIEAIER